MSKEFVDLYTVAIPSIQAKLESMQVKDFDVDTFSAYFNDQLVCYPDAALKADESQLKSIYLRAMPNRVREQVSFDKQLRDYSLAQLQTECKRI